MAPTVTSSSNPICTNLWQDALGSLHEDVKVSFDPTKTYILDIPGAVLRAAEAKREVCLQKKWKFKRANGDVMIVRDLLEKIIKWANCFKAISDKAVQFDATGAFLPWAAVRYLLQLSIDDIQIFGEMVGDLEAIARIITRYREFEHVHLHCQSAVRVILEEGLTGLYTEVLVHLARILNFFKDRSIVQIARSPFQVPDTVRMQGIFTKEAEMLKLANLADSEILHFLGSKVIRLLDPAAISVKALDNESHEKLLMWLSASPFVKHQQSHGETRISDSGGWLLSHLEYQNWWNSSSSSILLLHGAPGSGKTMLTSVVVDSLLDISSLNEFAAPFAYFYCSAEFEAERRASPDEILRSIVRQLGINEKSQPSVHDLLWSEYERRSAEAKVDGSDLSKLRIKDCVKVIIDLASADPVTIVIDGIDIIRDSGRYILLDALNRIVEGSANVVKIFVTSRNDSQIFSMLPLAKKISITSQDTKIDMDKFIHQRIESLLTQRVFLNGDASLSLRTKLAETLLNGADGTFLWAKLQIDSLRGKKHEQDIYQIVETLQTKMPKKLEELHEEILSQILGAGMFATNFAVVAISWLLSLKEPLSSSTFLEAISTTVATNAGALEIGLPEVIDLCFNLVVEDSRCNVIRFAHQSVRDFLQTKELFTGANAHKLLAMTCIKLCAQGPSTNINALTLQSDSLYSYATTYWASHYRDAELFHRDEALFHQMKSFVFDEDMNISLSFEAWINSAQELGRLLSSDHVMKSALKAVPSPVSSPLFIASIFGVNSLLDCLINIPIELDWDQKNDLGHTAIYLAAASGHSSFVQTLITLGANANIDCGMHRNPLNAACFSGYAEVVSLLLKYGASNGCQRVISALKVAFRNGHEDIALILLQEGPTINSEEDYNMAMEGAAQAGFLKTIEWLQSSALAALFKNSPDRIKVITAKAIQGGHLGVLRRFLQNSSETTSLVPDNAVAMASLYGHNDVISFLLEAGMNIEVESRLGTPLRVASLMNHESTVRLLLTRGAQINAYGSIGSALHVASMKGYIRVANLLIQEGADVNQKAGLYGTAMQAACYHGNREMIEVLLNAGASIYAKGLSKDAFHAAAEGGQHGIVVYLLENGYQVRHISRIFKCRLSRSSKYKALLRDASPGRKNHPRKRPEDRNSKNNVMKRGENNPLYSFKDAFGSVQGSRQSNGSVEPIGYKRDKDLGQENYAMEASAAAGHESIVKLLLKQREKLGISSGEVSKSLKVAALNGHLGVVRTLLDDAADRGPIFDHIQTVIDTAQQHEQEAVVSSVMDFAVFHCSKDEIDQLRTKILTDTEVFARLNIDKETVIQKFFEACEAGNLASITAIFSSVHRDQLEVKHLISGFDTSARKGHRDIVHLFLQCDALLDKMPLSDTSLLWSAGNGHLNLIKLLIPKMRNMDDFDIIITRALVISCENAHVEVVRYLLDEVPSINAVVPMVMPPGSFAYSGSTAPVQPLGSSPLQAALKGFICHYTESYTIFGRSWQWVNRGDVAAQEQVTLLLLSHGADPNELRGHNFNPLGFAVKWCSEHMIDRFFEAGAYINESNGSSVLWEAVGRELSTAKIVQRLVQAGVPLPHNEADINSLMDRVLGFFVGNKSRKYFHDADDPDGRFLKALSLDYVFREGPAAILRMLLSNFPEFTLKDERYDLVLQMAAFLNDLTFVQLLLERGVDVNSTGYYYGTALQAAARCGHLEMVSFLLNTGAKVNILEGRYQTALRAAIVGGHDETVQLLIDHGADIHLCYRSQRLYVNDRDKKSETALQLAVESGNIYVVKALLAAGANIHEDIAETLHPLIISCKKGNAGLAQVLVEAGAPINICGRKRPHYASMLPEDASPLHAACYQGNVDIVRILLDHGADVDKDVKDVDGEKGEKTTSDDKEEVGSTGPALLVAAKKGNVAIIRLLLAAGANVNHAWRRHTALSEAARYGHPEVVRDLLAVRATISGPLCINALSEACISRNPQVMELLLESVCGSENSEPIIDEALEKIVAEEDEKILRQILDYVLISMKHVIQACRLGSQSILQSMIEQGVDVNGSGKKLVTVHCMSPLPAYGQL